MSKHTSTGAAWQAVRKACLDRDGWVCTWCSKPLVGDDATADHYPVPVSQGGPDELWNLVASCRKCNSQRQDRAMVRTDWFDLAWFGGQWPL